MKSKSVTIQIKAFEPCCAVYFAILLYMVVLTFESVGEIVNKCDHLNDSDATGPCFDGGCL